MCTTENWHSSHSLSSDKIFHQITDMLTLRISFHFKLSGLPRSPWQSLAVWLPDLHGYVLVHVLWKSYSSHWPAAHMQQVSGSVRDVADPGWAVPLYEALSPACSHQGHLSTGQQRHPQVWCHWLSYSNPDLDQNFSLYWWVIQGHCELIKWFNTGAFLKSCCDFVVCTDCCQEDILENSDQLPRNLESCKQCYLGFLSD